MSGIKAQASDLAIGIDFGTSNSSISLFLQKGGLTSLKIDGEQKIPSVIWYNGKSTSDKRVGADARSAEILHPDQVFSSIKRIMADDDWKTDEAMQEKLSLKDKDGNQVKVTPVDITSEILSYIVNSINENEEYQKFIKGSVKKAIICVPANTTDTYCLNIYKAAVKAGLGQRKGNQIVLVKEKGKNEKEEKIIDIEKIDEEISNSGFYPKGIKLVNEPTAAALAYCYEMGLMSAKAKQNVLVYDLGGGTFDVTLINIDAIDDPENPIIEVLACDGIRELGGDDFDNAIVTLCAEKFMDETNIDVMNFAADNMGTPPRNIKMARTKLKRAAEEAKVKMGHGLQKTIITIPDFLEDGNSRKYTLEVEVRKEDLLKRIKPLLEQANEKIHEVLASKSFTLDNVNRVILVGGSTKAEWIKDSICKLYPRGKERAPWMTDDPDTVVSRGAALYATDRLTINKKKEKIPEIKEILTHTLGIETKGGIFSPIILKGAKLTEDDPVKIATQTFGNPDYTEEASIAVYKTSKEIEFDDAENMIPARAQYVGERDDAGKRIFECIGEFTYHGLLKEPEGTTKIDVTFQINMENLLQVSAKIQANEDSEKKIQLQVTKD